MLGRWGLDDCRLSAPWSGSQRLCAGTLRRNPWVKKQTRCRNHSFSRGQEPRLLQVTEKALGWSHNVYNQYTEPGMVTAIGFLLL